MVCIRLDLLRDRKSTDYKYVPRVIEKGGRSRSQQTQFRRIATPLFRGFLPGKRHAAQIASRDLGSIGLFVTFCIARTEAFLMASNVVILDGLIFT